MQEFILVVLIPGIAEAIGSGIDNKVQGNDVIKSVQSGFAGGIANGITLWLMLSLLKPYLGVVQ